MSETEGFKGWCIVELMGHQRIAGMVSGAEIGGIPFLRIDIPDAETRYYGRAAIFGVHPTTSDLCLELASQGFEPVVSPFDVERRPPVVGGHVALGEDEIRAAKEAMGWPLDEPFYIPDDVRALFAGAMQSGAEARQAWEHRRDAAFTSDRDLEGRWRSYWEPAPVTVAATGFEVGESVATRKASGAAINSVAGQIPGLIGGSAAGAARTAHAARTLRVHRVQELVVGIGGLDLLEQDFDIGGLFKNIQGAEFRGLDRGLNGALAREEHDLQIGVGVVYLDGDGETGIPAPGSAIEGGLNIVPNGSGWYPQIAARLIYNF